MARELYFYSPLAPADLNVLLEAFQKEFDELVGDSFSDDELALFERQLDNIAAVDAQPLDPELSFDDLEALESEESAQRFIFEACQSFLVFENLPYLEENPFQVSYLRSLFSRLSEGLIDRGGMAPLISKARYLEELRSYKDLDQLLVPFVPKSAPVKASSKPVDPIDFLIQDVYSELARMLEQQKLTPVLTALSEQSEKLKKIFFVMREEKLDASDLLRKTGLGAKEFDDTLERLKFFLRKF